MGDGGLVLGDVVGREAELETASRLLAGPVRLLTLTGPPGVGKTTLARALITLVGAEHADGAAFVDLSPAPDAVSALGEIARVLGVTGAAGERTGLRVHQAMLDRDLLLVLDNAERVRRLAEELGSILRDCPGVQLLLTSREPMHLAAETELPVAPLAVPSAEDVGDLEALAATPSVALFVGAARAVRPGFRVTAGNAAPLVDVCVRLEGLPLALRLAAARTKVFGVAEIAGRLRDRRAILEASGPDGEARHRTLQAAIEWSHAVLTARERRLFRRLSVFAGAWSLEAAERVCGAGDDDVADTLRSLVDKSLVQRTDADGARASFALLASLRDFAADQLQPHERGPLAARHAGYCTAVARRVEETIGTAEEGTYWWWTSRHEADLRSALDRSLSAGRTEAAFVLATALGWAWYSRGHLGEAAALLSEPLTVAEHASRAPGAGGVAPALPAPVLVAAARTVAGAVAWGRGDLGRAETLLQAARASCLACGDSRRVAMASAFLGHVARDRGDLDSAVTWHRDAEARYEALRCVRGAAWARFDLGRVAWTRGDLGEAARFLREALHGFHDSGYQWAVAWASWALGTVDAERGAPDDGLRLLGRALREFDATSDLRGVASTCESLAAVVSVRDRHVEAMQLLGVAGGLRLRIGVPASRSEAARVVATEAAARRVLGDYGVDREREIGRRLAMAQVHDLVGALVPGAPRTGVPGSGAAGATASSGDARALGGTASSGTGAALGGTASSGTAPALGALTQREREVAELVAEGLTNRAIGRRLHITDRTVEAHLHHILGKLGARSRAEVAVWAALHGAVGRVPG